MSFLMQNHIKIPRNHSSYGGYFYAPKHDVTPRVVAIAVRMLAIV